MLCLCILSPVDRSIVADATVVFVILRVSNVPNRGVSKELQAQIYFETSNRQPSTTDTNPKTKNHQNVREKKSKIQIIL